MNLLYPHPVLHKATLDYHDPGMYRVGFEKKNIEGTTFIQIEHELDNGKSLISSLMEKNEAVFYSTVSVGNSCYRRTEKIGGVKEGGNIVAKQCLEIPNFKDVREIFVCTGVAMSKGKSIKWKNAKGVVEFHKTEKLIFRDHALLAFEGWKRFYPSGALFRIKSDSDMEEGAFRAEANYGGEVLQIVVTMAPKLFDEVESNKNGTARAHVLCASLIPTLMELQQIQTKISNGEEHDSTEENKLKKAKGLQAYFESQQIPIWGEEDFNAVEAASRYKPARWDLEGGL